MLRSGLINGRFAVEHLCKRSGGRLAVREYSSESGKDSMFLTDLLSRIDKISSTTKKIAEQQGSGVGGLNKSRGVPGSAQGAPRRAKGPADKTVKTRNEKVQVADHPLFNAKIENRGPNRQSGGYKGPRAPRVARTGGGAGAPATSGAGNARPSKRTTRPREPRRQKAIDVQPIKSKNITYGPYKPQLDNNTFLYGKATSFNNCTSARVASVAKEALNDSKFPYMLPRDIVNNLTPGVTRNRFLLQSNFTLDVNSKKLTTRIKEVVKGEVADLPVDKSQFKDPEALKSALFTKQQLMKNGDLSFADKQKIFAVASGLKTPKQLVENAHWAKAE
ncbi:uncharacterized protein AC631_04947 [Debaryomyces fabryi]|uniref:Uncharacterized protein n=1 Tax=Debaryomyces fabryi TaxID=58627 RepID=A0A0V1PSS3_9ASCO|nr:uncharacterized protein AC631_04947 [Debaryomyces fabryi]KRZ99299.1 hypothetical protein AC631_04947 [Debaryomyces fabryi]CUM47496.1 unnamed protein product [Debaryomyces fabryi]